MTSKAKFSIDEIVESTGGHIIYPRSGQIPESLRASKASISTDSRTIAAGDAYIALKGERFDGHSFVLDAIESGAGIVIVSSSTCDSIIEQLQNDNAVSDLVIISSDDTLSAYHLLARAWRLKINPFVVAVTGSSGKTTTKEMCASVFSRARRFHKSEKNENNEFGIPKTILSMSDDTQVLVCEMAMRGLGQIDQLAATAVPDVGIITCAGTAHIELLGSRENIARAKCELLKHLGDNGVAVLGSPTELLLTEAFKVFSGKLRTFDDADVVELDVTESGTTFLVKSLKAEFFVKAHGAYHLQDAWCAVMAGVEAGLTHDEIKDGLLTYSQVKGRGNVLITRDGVVIVDESYNANPDSVRCAVDGVIDARAFPQKRKIVVLGEMAELGPASENLHKELGAWIKDKPIDLLITVGAKAAAIGEAARGSAFEVRQCHDIPEALKTVRPQLTSDACIMIKGSNCARLYDLVDELIMSKQAD